MTWNDDDDLGGVERVEPIRRLRPSPPEKGVMNEFKPGPGWRESDGIPSGIEGIVLFPADGGMRKTWVREAPVPPLPTDAWSVVRLYGGDYNPAGTVVILDDGGDWVPLYDRSVQGARNPHYQRIEVLSEPRAVTAKAVGTAMCERYESLGKSRIGYATIESQTDPQFGVTQ